MFIEPSKRRHQRASVTNAKPLHEMLAKRHYWHWRLLICSVLALLGALLGFLIGLPILWHALVSAGLGVAGFFVPLRRSLAWALGWIDQASGLSYRTALEHTGKDDPYGFAAATKARAEALTTRLETPRLQPWWLPLMVLAAGLVIIPQLISPNLNASSPPGATPGQETGSDSTLANEQFGQDPDEAEPREDAAAPADDDEDVLAGEEEADEMLEQDLSGARDYDLVEGQEDASSEVAGADSERDALDRFLEDRDEETQEMQLERAEMRQEQRASPSEQRAQDAEQGDEGDEAGLAELSEEPNGDQEQGGDETAMTQTTEGEGDEGEAEAETSAQVGEDGDDENGSSTEAAQDGEAGDPEAGSAPSMSDQADGMQPDEGVDDSAFPGAGAEGAQGEDSAEAPLDDSMAPFTFLQGQRDEEGPANFLGETFMPGSDDDLIFPEGQAPEGFERTIEEAISEGRIPVEYQDIVRQYFR